jgi:hypothetical protein
MEQVAKLIHKTDMTYLPTAFPAHFYGMPDGKIYIVFSRFYKVNFSETGLEFIFAEHKEFAYDYELEKILPSKKGFRKIPIFAETIDKPNPEIKILKIDRSLNSYGEAFIYLNSTAQEMKKPRFELLAS